MKQQQQQLPLQIISIQTHLTQYHYQSYPILRDYFLRCIHFGKNPSSTTSSHHRTLVIFPECTGTWLYYMCVPMPNFLRRFFFHTSTNRHFLFIIYTLITHMRLFCKHFYENYRSRTSWSGLIQYSWFSLFADRTFEIYKNLFSDLSRQTNSFIVAGSLFTLKNKHLYNMSYVFEPTDGSICLQSGKIYPVSDESSFIHSYQQLPLIYSIPETNIDIGVLICADSWMPEVYERYNRIELHSNRRFLFIIVALNLGQWDMPWPGYDSTVATPTDVESKHLKTYSLGQAWFHYAVNRAFQVLEKRNRFQGYGVICCQGVLNLMNDIQGEGESMILLKRSKDDDSIISMKADRFNEENILSCLF